MVFLCMLNTLQNTCLQSPSATSQSGATACRYAMLQQHLPQCSRGTTFANSNGCGAERITRPTTSGWSTAPAPPISAEMAVGTISAFLLRIVVQRLGVSLARQPFRELKVCPSQLPPPRGNGGGTATGPLSVKEPEERSSDRSAGPHRRIIRIENKAAATSC